MANNRTIAVEYIYVNGASEAGNIIIRLGNICLVYGGLLFYCFKSLCLKPFERSWNASGVEQVGAMLATEVKPHVTQLRLELNLLYSDLTSFRHHRVNEWVTDGRTDGWNNEAFWNVRLHFISATENRTPTSSSSSFFSSLAKMRTRLTCRAKTITTVCVVHVSVPWSLQHTAH